MGKLVNTTINSLGYLYLWLLLSIIWKRTVNIRYMDNSYLTVIILKNIISLSVWTTTVISELLWNGMLKNFLKFRSNTNTSNILIIFLIISIFKHLIFLSKQFNTIFTIHRSIDLICNIQLLLLSSNIHILKKYPIYIISYPSFLCHFHFQTTP